MNRTCRTKALTYSRLQVTSFRKKIGFTFQNAHQRNSNQDNDMINDTAHRQPIPPHLVCVQCSQSKQSPAKMYVSASMRREG